VLNEFQQGKKKWIVPRKGNAEARAIQPGDVGIWATCAMKKEAKSVADLRDLFQEVGVMSSRIESSTNSFGELLTRNQYLSKMYEVNRVDGTAEDGESDSEEGDIEADIQKELEGIRKPTTKPLFTSVKLDTQCCEFDSHSSFNHALTDQPVIFFKTRQPVEPVAFVQKICQDAANGVPQPLCRFVKRLTPITATAKATDKGLDEVAQQVLAPHFHGPDRAGKKVG
jgi:tRNA acetyltransferase TAN1